MRSTKPEIFTIQLVLKKGLLAPESNCGSLWQSEHLRVQPMALLQQ